MEITPWCLVEYSTGEALSIEYLIIMFAIVLFYSFIIISSLRANK